MIDITSTSTAANVLHVLSNLTLDHAKAYEKAQDKYLFVFDTFCDAVSIDDIPIVIILDIEDRLEELLAS
tara:strand:- start:1194 stop:1403 length:210 start_codon:yes stop_codon:yes gene_type:complete